MVLFLQTVEVHPRCAVAEPIVLRPVTEAPTRFPGRRIWLSRIGARPPHLHTQARTRTCTHVRTRMYTHTHVCTRTHIHSHPHTCRHPLVHTCTHAHTHGHTCTHVEVQRQMDIHIHIETHAKKKKCNKQRHVVVKSITSFTGFVSHNSK